MQELTDMPPAFEALLVKAGLDPDVYRAFALEAEVLGIDWEVAPR